MVNNLFVSQPAYHKDLLKASVTIAHALENSLHSLKTTMVGEALLRVNKSLTQFKILFFRSQTARHTSKQSKFVMW